MLSHSSMPDGLGRMEQQLALAPGEEYATAQQSAAAELGQLKVLDVQEVADRWVQRKLGLAIVTVTVCSCMLGAGRGPDSVLRPGHGHYPASAAYLLPATAALCMLSPWEYYQVTAAPEQQQPLKFFRLHPLLHATCHYAGLRQACSLAGCLMCTT